MPNILLGSTKLFIFVGILQLILSSKADGTVEFLKCPELLDKIPNVCERLQCEKLLTPGMCPPESIFVHDFALCGCCPSCVKYLGIDETCQEDEPEKWTLDPECKDNSCPVKVNRCSPGLFCNLEKKCQLPSKDERPNPEVDECMFRKTLFREDLTHWDPNCEADGSFSRKQCKGNYASGECFCTDRQGGRIFGREWREQAENQTCACSRRVFESRTDIRSIGSFHCSADGNFEPLQCNLDLGVCFCVDPKTGDMDGSVVPESQWKLLPCFAEFLNLTKQKTDAQYLRQCDSEWAALRQLTIIGNEHSLVLGLKALACDYDGSFAIIQRSGIAVTCVFKNGTKIKSYSASAGGDANCNCARDVEEYYPSQERPLSLACQENTGNFDVAYDFGSQASCVDKDGFLYGNLVPSDHICCLLNDGCSAETRKSCYDQGEGAVNEDGIKHCDFWYYRS